MKRELSVALTLCFVFAVGLSMSACTKQESASDAPDLTGVYALVSVNEDHVPASISHEGSTLQVLSGTFVINADGTCSSKTIFVPPSGTEVVREVAATYVKDGSKLTMQWEGAGKTVGTVENNTFTMDNEGMMFVYEKQEMQAGG